MKKIKKICAFCSEDLPTEQIHFSRVICRICTVTSVHNSLMCWACYCEQEQHHIKQEHLSIDITGEKLWIG